MLYNFRKITPINGFDAKDPDNAMQNNYAWSMEELGDHIYVGTGRNILFNFVQMMKLQFGITLNLPDELIPRNYDNRAEIWRYDKKHPAAGWERVFKSPATVLGFRYMIAYKSPSGETALYAAGYALDTVKLFKSTTGAEGTWEELPNTGVEGSSTRSMVVHKDKLYMSTIGIIGGAGGLFVTTDPATGWAKVPGPSKVTGPAIMSSFNGHLYADAPGTEGFELWRTNGDDPASGWKLVIDKGAGDALNLIGFTLGTFQDNLYVGVIDFPFTTEANLTGFKPFDVVRIDKNDNWQLIIGGPALKPTNPQTGTRNPALSGLPSGMGRFTNLYPWQIQQYNGELYLGSFDYSVTLLPILSANWPWIQCKLLSKATKLGQDFMNRIVNLVTESDPLNGFDLYKSRDGIHWEPITLGGFDNAHNYGARILFVSQNGRLYLGTANPFDGCEVWEKC